MPSRRPGRPAPRRPGGRRGRRSSVAEASSISPTVLVALLSGRRRVRRSAATGASGRSSSGRSAGAGAMTTNRRTALTASGQPATTLIGVRITRIARTTSWKRKQPRPGPTLRLEVGALVLDRRPVDRAGGRLTGCRRRRRCRRSLANDTGAVANAPRARTSRARARYHRRCPTACRRTARPTRPATRPRGAFRLAPGAGADRVSTTRRARGRPSRRSARPTWSAGARLPLRRGASGGRWASRPATPPCAGSSTAAARTVRPVGPAAGARRPDALQPT